MKQIERPRRTRLWIGLLFPALLALGISISPARTVLPSLSLDAGKPKLPTIWTFTWKSAPGEGAPTAVVCPLKYGKKWAYTVEIDDGPASTLTVSQPLLAQFAFTDAPPGVRGGKSLPFVGGAAVIVTRVGTSNDTFLNWEQLKTLRQKGWGVLSHSYWHSGNSWEPQGALTPDQFRTELYWSQALLAAEGGTGRSPIHLVYPNGYTAYELYLAEFGLRSASRIAGKFPNVTQEALNLHDLDRNYLDEGPWAQANDPMVGIPASPKEGDFVIDFTHGMEAAPDSVNHKRWQTRLSTIASRYGKDGDDSLWSAPTSEVVAYALASRAATVRCQKGRLTLSIPSDLLGTSITVKLTGINPASRLVAPVGGSLYRKGNQVWVTTKVLGLPEASPPSPRLKRVYSGPVQNVKLEKPVKIAAVRLLQFGEVKPGYHLKIELTTPSGQSESLVTTDLPPNWGSWLLYPTIPARPAPLASGVTVASDPALTTMEIWAIAP